MFIFPIEPYRFQRSDGHRQATIDRLGKCINLSSRITVGAACERLLVWSNISSGAAAEVPPRTSSHRAEAELTRALGEGLQAVVAVLAINVQLRPFAWDRWTPHIHVSLSGLRSHAVFFAETCCLVLV